MTAGELFERYPLTSRIVAFAVALEVFFVFMHGVNSAFFGDGYFFALDHDLSLPSWATGALFTLGGAGCGLLAWADRGVRAPFAALSVVAFGLSLEQTAQLHGRIEETVSASKAIEIVIGIAVILIIVLAARALSQPFNLVLLSSIGFLVISVLASQMNQSFEDMPKAGIVFFQTIEEICEMLTAWAIIAAVAEPLWRAIGLRSSGLSEPRPTRAPAAETPPQVR